MNTNLWKLDLFSALESANSLQSIMDASLQAVAPFGFDFCGWRTDLPAEGKVCRKGNVVALNAVEDKVLTETVKGGYQDAPIPRHCATSFLPISWRGTFSDDVFVQAPDIWEEYYAMGHRGGWAIATMAQDGSRGMFFVESKHILSTSDMQCAEQHMHWVSAAACVRIHEIKLEADIHITKLERKLINVLAKCNANEFHAHATMAMGTTCFRHLLSTLMAKLECNDIHTMIARAMFLGILS